MVVFLILCFPGYPRSLRCCSWNDLLISGAQHKPVGLDFVGKPNIPLGLKILLVFCWCDAVPRALAGVHSLGAEQQEQGGTEPPTLSALG